ncbi:hypothetical protein BDQ17DRAFT_1427232 [Cyathus striatus]|nr:hypothetical protein BDQ17DRAFT_1427232 [Cyathus striatus]
MASSDTIRQAAPVRKLHNEILAEIFLYVCCEPIKICVGPGPIWDLQLVCTRWHKVVKETPSLWSAFEVNVKGSKLKTSTILRRVKSCLQLSRTVPLSISFLDSPQRSRFGCSIYEDAAKHANRWVSFTVDGDLLYYLTHKPGPSPVKSFIKKRGLAKLRKLAIQYVRHEVGSDEDQCPFDIFRSATALEEVKWCRLVSIPKASHIFPWSKVKKLTIEKCTLTSEISEKQTISMFNALSSLEVLTWKNNYTMREAISKTQVITLPSLHTLILQDTIDHHRSDLQIWCMLRTPSLTNVQIAHDVKQPDPFSLMVQSSASTVKTLQLKSCSTSFFRSVIKVLSNVEELSLLEPADDSSDILLELVWNPTGKAKNGKSLSHLQKLELRDLSSKNEEFMSSLMKVMRSRSKAAAAVTKQQSSLSVVPLLSVICTFKKNESGDDPSIVRLKNLGEELGIEIKVAVTDDLPIVRSCDGNEESDYYDDDSEDYVSPSDDEAPLQGINGLIFGKRLSKSDGEGDSDSGGDLDGEGDSDSEGDLDGEGDSDGGDSDGEDPSDE